MKFISLGFLVVALLMTGCSKKMPDEEVTAKVAEALCGKMKECAPGPAFDGASCTTTLKASLMTPLAAHGKKGKVTEKELAACVKEIQSQTCTTFSAPMASSSCSFFKG
jgi:hypothetical protein